MNKNNRYPIPTEGTFTCRCCNLVKDISEIKKGNAFSMITRMGICKECTSNYSKSREKRRAAERMPHNYMECADCDEIFSKFQGRKLNAVGERMLVIECPYCKSEEIDAY